MNFDTKLKYLIISEVFLTAVLILLIYLLPENQVSAYRLWEIFPAVIAAAITTFGLKSMRKKT